MADQVTLFGTWASRFSRRIEIALKLKGVVYEYVEEDLHNKSALLLQYNPVHNMIPVLVHNGKVIVESLIILEYIEETWENNPILPQHPYDRAIARFWAKFIDEKLSMASLWRAVTKKEGDEKGFCGLLKMLEDQLKGKDYFGGESVGYLDIAGTTVSFWLPVIEQALGVELITAERFPELHKWCEKLMRVDAVLQCVPPRDKHVEYMKQRLNAA